MLFLQSILVGEPSPKKETGKGHYRKNLVIEKGVGWMKVAGSATKACMR